MKKTNLKYFVDILMFLCIVGIAGIGFLMGFFLAEGPAVREQDKYFLSLHRHQWGEIHLYLSLVFTALVILHLFLNWEWVKCKTRVLFKSGWRPMLIATAILAVLIPLILWAFYPKYPQEYLDYGAGQGRRQTQNFTLPPQNRVIQNLPDTGRIREEKPRQEQPSQPLTERPRWQEQQAVTAEKETPEHEEQLVHGRLETEAEGFVLHGQMTMQDVINQTGIPYEKIADAMGLPSRIPLRESLGRLRRRYGFTMQELRDTLTALMK
jgi:hypothetical protein